MSRSQIAGTIIGFFLLTFAVYGLSLGNNFVAWDDNYLIVSNPIIKGFSWSHIVSAFTSYDPELYDPLIFLVYQFNYTVAGLNPFMFHFTNLVLHTLNALGVCWLLFLLTKKKWAGIIAGLLFAVHPLNTEAVSWSAATKDVLSTFFFLASAISYLYYRDESTNKKRQYTVSIVTFLLGLLSKVMVLTLPLVLLLIDIRDRRPWSWKMLIEKIPYFALSWIFGVIALFGKQDVVTESTLFEKILMACKSTMFYIGSYIAPVHLTVLYPYSKPITIASPDFLIPVSLLAGLFAVILLSWNKMRDISIGLLLYGITLMPTFFNFAKGGYFYVASDRYAYVPQIGLLLILLFLIDRFIIQSRVRHSREYVFIGSGIIVTILAALSFQQSLIWKNTETLFLQTLKYYPNAMAARLNLGYVYRESSMYEKALEQFNTVIEKEPTNGLAYANKGVVYQKQGKIDDAIAMFKKGIEVSPKERDLYMSLGLLYEKEDKLDDALANYQKAQEVSPNYAPVYNNLGSIYVQKNDLSRALESYKKAIEINPYYADAHFNLAYIYAKQGDADAAEREYETTLAIEGDSVETLHTLAGLYAEQNKTAETIKTLQRILQIDPTNEFATKLMAALRQHGLVQ